MYCVVGSHKYCEESTTCCVAKRFAHRAAVRIEIYDSANPWYQLAITITRDLDLGPMPSFSSTFIVDIICNYLICWAFAHSPIFIRLCCFLLHFIFRCLGPTISSYHFETTSPLNYFVAITDIFLVTPNFSFWRAMRIRNSFIGKDSMFIIIVFSYFSSELVVNKHRWSNGFLPSQKWFSLPISWI